MARSAKQRANDRRLGQMAKRRSKSTRKVNKRRKSSSNHMARRRSSRRRSYSRGFSRIRRSGKLGGIVGTIKPMASGIGMGLIAENIAGRFMPQASMIAGYGGAYLGGGVKGVIGKVVYDSILGGGGLGNLFGGSSGGGGAL